MDERIDVLAGMFSKMEAAIAAVGPSDHGLPTPCAEYTVGGLLEHVAIWIQVFDGAVNEDPVAFDPMTHRISEDFVDIFHWSTESIIADLRRRGYDRPMTMTANPMPGEYIVNMMLMEYVGHGWDLARATGRALPFDDSEAQTALTAAEAILEPQYRASGMFGEIVAVADDAPAIDRYVAFIGRNPSWQPPA